MRPRLPLTPAFRRLWLADAVSVVGDALSTTTVLLWVYGQSGNSGLWVSAFVIASALPQVLAGPLLGTLADRPDRVRLMVRLDLLRAAVGLLLAPVVYFGLTGPALACVALMSGAGTIFSAAQQAALPDSVDERDLPRANAIMSLTTQVSFVVGPALAAVLMNLVGPVPAVLFDAVTFLGSALVLAGLRLPGRQGTGGSDAAPVRGSVRPVLRAVTANRTLLVAAAAAVLLALSAGINNTVMVIYLDQALGGSPGDIAWLSGTNGVAQIVVGSAVIGIAARLPVARSIGVSLAVMAAFSILLAAATNVPVAVVAVAAVAMANAPFNIAYATLRQTGVGGELVGRLFAVTGGLGSAAFLLGSLCGGLLADAASARTSIVVSTVFLLVAAVLATPLWRTAAASDRTDDGADKAVTSP